MKRILLLFALILLSCSNDDDNSQSESQNLIVGVWKPIKEIDRCPNQADDVYNLTECEQMGRLTFNSNGTLSDTGFNENGEDCEISYESNSTWEIRNGELFVDDNGVEEKVEFFEVTQNILKLGELDNDFCNGGIYFTEYQKV